MGGEDEAGLHSGHMACAVPQGLLLTRFSACFNVLYCSLKMRRF